MAERKRWCGSRSECDICGADISVGKCEFFVDGKTKQGPWALMCPDCLMVHGVGIGYGVGQMYDGMSETPWLMAGGKESK